MCHTENEIKQLPIKLAVNKDTNERTKTQTKYMN